LSGIGKVDVLEPESGLQQLELHRNQHGFLQFLGHLALGADVHRCPLQQLDVLLATPQMLLHVDDHLALGHLLESRT
jgi:hypothetical protein